MTNELPKYCDLSNEEREKLIGDAMRKTGDLLINMSKGYADQTDFVLNILTNLCGNFIADTSENGFLKQNFTQFASIVLKIVIARDEDTKTQKLND